MSRTNSSYSDSRVPAPRRHFSASADNNNDSADDFRNVHQEAEEEEEGQQPSLSTSSLGGWTQRQLVDTKPSAQEASVESEEVKMLLGFRRQLDCHRLSVMFPSSSRESTYNCVFMVCKGPVS